MTARSKTVACPWIAAVYSQDGVRYVAVAPTRSRLSILIARYVTPRAPYVLWSEDAERVLALLNSGYVEAAIDVYFARVGRRWDAESLRVMQSSDASAIAHVGAEMRQAS